MPVTLLTSPTTLDAPAKSSKPLTQPLMDAGALRFQQTLVLPQAATLNTAIVQNSIALNQVLDLAALTGVISTIGQPANTEQMTSLAAAPNMNQGPLLADQALQKTLSTLAQAAFNSLPISSLSDIAIGYPAITQTDALAPGFNLGMRSSPTQTAAAEMHLIDLPLNALGAPVAITQLSNAQSKVMVIDSAAANVRVADVKLSLGLTESAIYSNLALLNLAEPTVGSLSASIAPAEQLNVQLAAVELSSGITVSGSADGPGFALFIGGVQDAMMNGAAAAEFTPLFLAELRDVGAGQIQIRLTGTVTLADTDIPPGTLILGG